MKGVGIADHCPGLDNTVWLSRQPETRKRLDRQMRGPDGAYFSTLLSRYEKPPNISLTLFKGIECNILGEGHIAVDVPDFLADRFDIVIASLHDLPHLFQVKNREQVTDRMIQAMSEPVDIIGHPYHKKCCPIMERFVKAAAEKQVALELNNSSIKQGKADVDEAKLMLSLAKEYGCPISVASDAHMVSEVGENRDAVALLKEVDFPEKLIVNRDITSAVEFVNSRKRKRTKISREV